MAPRVGKNEGNGDRVISTGGQWRLGSAAMGEAENRVSSDVFCEKYDNLLVDADIFTVLGVSFCVTQNAFNFIKIKKNMNIGAHFSKSYIPLCCPFFNLV